MSDPPQGRERRRHPRRHIELKVEYKRLNAFFSDYTKNISKGGTFIRTTKPLDIGTEFVFKLYVPKLDEPLEIRGRVKWMVTEEDVAAHRNPPDRRDPGMGIRFIYDDDDERDRISKVVERLMVDSLGPALYTKLTADSPEGGPGSDSGQS